MALFEVYRAGVRLASTDSPGCIPPAAVQQQMLKAHLVLKFKGKIIKKPVTEDLLD